MAGMKVTVDAAMRARDVSRPHAEHEVLAQSLDAEAASQARPTAARPARPSPTGTASQRRQAPLRPETDPAGPSRPPPPVLPPPVLPPAVLPPALLRQAPPPQTPLPQTQSTPSPPARPPRAQPPHATTASATADPSHR